MSLLFAQQALPEPPSHASWFILGAAIVAASLLFMISVAGARARHRRREWKHAERMRMIEAGLPIPPGAGADWARASVCISLGVGVPLLAFVFTWLAYGSHTDAADELWVAPMAVSVAAVISTAVLAAYLFRGSVGSGREAGHGSVTGAGVNGEDVKPPLDPDAFDVVGSRG
jgi:hypothetical protein